jgi:hypothetical protein
MTAIAQTAQSNVATRLLAGVSVPDTALISVSTVDYLLNAPFHE